MESASGKTASRDRKGADKHDTKGHSLIPRFVFDPHDKPAILANMIADERFKMLLVTGIVALVYVAAAGIILRWGWQKLTGKKRSKASVAARLARSLVLTLAGIGTLCIAWGYFVEPYWIEVTHTRIESPKLNKAKRPIRLVHLSDFHSDVKIRNEEKLPQIIADLKPDIIVYTGDSVNTPEATANLQNCLKALAEIAPTYVVGGNWDERLSGHYLFTDTNTIQLNGKPRRIEIAGQKIWLAGCDFGHEDRIDRVLDSVDNDQFVIFLHHYPDMIATLAGKVDLHLAGHTHGGQICLPFYGAIVTFSHFGKKFEAGHYEVQGTHLYVNRGIGMEGGRAPRVRFWCRPEVAVIELAPKGK